MLLNCDCCAIYRLVETVQNSFMAIVVQVGRLTRREQFEEDTRRFIEDYCADHSAFLADPAAYYRAQRHKRTPNPARGFGDDGSQPRYFSPYDEENRFRHYEAVGGYRCTINRRNGVAISDCDGVAVRAKQGHTRTANESTGAESFRFVSGNRATHKPVLPQASLPNPVKTGGRWEYPDSPHFFTYAALYRSKPAVRVAAVEHRPFQFPGTPRGFFTSLASMNDRRKIARAKGTSNHFEHFYQLRPEDFIGYQPTDEEIAEWQQKHWFKGRLWRKVGSNGSRRWEYREGRLEPLCACPACQKWWPNLERVDWRTVWSETGEDLTTRKMRDLNARLELYRYGDRHWQPGPMKVVTSTRLYEARLRVAACGGRPYFWPIEVRYINERAMVRGTRPDESPLGPACNSGTRYAQSFIGQDPDLNSLQDGKHWQWAPEVAVISRPIVQSTGRAPDFYSDEYESRDQRRRAFEKEALWRSGLKADPSPKSMAHGSGGTT